MLSSHFSGSGLDDREACLERVEVAEDRDQRAGITIERDQAITNGIDERDTAAADVDQQVLCQRDGHCGVRIVSAADVMNCLIFERQYP